MAVDSRNIALPIAGFCTFLNLYSPQALLPTLSREFGVGVAEISTIMTASTLAIALTAPFTGAVADVLGRKRVITAAMLAVVVPMIGAASAPDVQALIVWRFIQGLLLPPIFAITVAYIGDEWPPARVSPASTSLDRAWADSPAASFPVCSVICSAGALLSWHSRGSHW